MMKFAGLVLAASLIAPTYSWAQEFTMRIASGANSAGWTCKEFLTSWAEKVKTESGGRIGYQLYCDGTLGKMGDTINRVQDGVAEVGWDVPLAYGARFAAYGLVGLPNLFDGSPKGAGGALWKLYEEGTLPPVTGVKVAMLQVLTNIYLWTAKQVEDLTKLNGLKVGIGSKERAIIIEGMGGVPLSLRVPEYYQALAKGSADGLFGASTAVFDFSVEELTKNAYQAPFGGGLVGIFMNQAWYDALPADLKKVIDANTGYEASKWSSDILFKKEQEDMQAAARDKGVQTTRLSAEQLQGWQGAFDAATQSWTSSIPDGAKYLDAFKTKLKAEGTN